MKSDRPLDAMIAEHVMHTEKYWAIRWGGSGYGDFPTYDEAVIHELKIFGDRRAIIIPYWDEPCYSTDISAAWQVVEKLGMVTIENATPHGPWSVGFTAHDCEGEPHWVHVEADTAPLAICLAALKACGVEVEKS